MKKRIVLSHKNRRMHMPLVGTAVLYLLLEHWQATGWVWGACMSVMALLWIASAIDCWTSEERELWKDEPK